ncbi:WD repeat-containing and planar cell polarity effector protein fritz-like [Exaiptasia diaphana]|nr:WD repeat-containing and planar cell polarity effector protein fritz-like [Exaiptasia diaphana]
MENFENFTVITCLVSSHSGDVEKIFIDKSLVGKIPDQVCSAIITEGFLVFAFLDKSKLLYVHLSKKSSLDFKKAEKISSLEPKLSFTDLVGPTSKRMERHLSINQRQDMIAVWWGSQSEEVWPWSPMTGEKDRSNMIIFGISGTKLEMLCFVRTDCDPIDLSFSHNQPHHVLTLEQSLNDEETSSVDNCIYEYTKNKIERVAVTTIPINSAVKVQKRNQAEDKLLIGCENGTLMLYDSHRRITQMTNAAVTPYYIQWHPADVVVLVCGEKGEIQVFDMALAPLFIQLLAANPQPQRVLQLNKYFQNPPRLDIVTWSCEAPIMNITEGSVGCHDNLLILFDGGPMCMIRVELGVLSHGKLGAVELVSEYIKHEQGEQAVNFLNSMNWNTEGNACFACMTLIMTYLLRLTLNSEREGLLEETLGSFYAPSRPLSDVTVLQFRDPISRLSRRFFHHLLRYKRFEKAFLLAVDIGAKDLFMDIHYLSMDVGNYALADVAKQRAIQIDNESLSASDTGESYDEDSYEGSVENDRENVETRDYRSRENNVNQSRGRIPERYNQDSPASSSPYSSRRGVDSSPQPSSSESSNHQEPSTSGAASGGTLKIVHFGVV